MTKKPHNWHACKTDRILQELDTNTNGLQEEEAKQRLQSYGENSLPQAKGESLLKIILHQIINPLIFILIAAAIASILIGEAKDAVFIFLVILINSTLGTIQEYNAAKSAASLQNLLKIKAQVKRDGETKEIDSRFLVPGDIVYLESGMKVPADIRLIDVSNLSLDESFLTGESIAAKKEIRTLRTDTSVGDRTNIAHTGAMVNSGRGMGVVVETGSNTQLGKIAQDVSESASAKPPLVQRMDKFIKQISIFIIALSVILAVILRSQGMDFTAIFFFVVALAVSAIPEGLPVALTVALSIATKRMAKRNVIVRKLHSVESLGSCTIIASDKTGTLTLNEQTAKAIILPSKEKYQLSGQGYNGEGKILDEEEKELTTISEKENSALYFMNKIAVMANEASLKKENEAWNHFGDAMDVAILGMSYKMGLHPDELQDDIKLIDRIAYESENKYSAAFCLKNEITRIGVKGAVETVLNFSDKMFVENKKTAIDKKKIEEQAYQMAKKGYRVLAVAGGEYPDFEKKETYQEEDIPALTFYGLLCFIDPLREEAKESVAKCNKAGIKVIMITGDHPATAETISKELGIAKEGEKVVTGKMLEEIGSSDTPAFKKIVFSTSVFARVSPSQKLEIVDVLIKNGEFVAVTGDGVNDAPALKRANIGVAMGSGTDVAKDVGQMIVVDDNFSSIVSGVEEGRFAYDNVRKVIYLLISTGAAEIVLFLASVFSGLELPLIAVQLLWLNLVTNGIQDVALAFEGGEPGAMRKKPRKPGETIFNGLMIQQTVISGLVMGSLAYGLWYWLTVTQAMPTESARNYVLLLMVFLQNFHVFNARSEYTSAFRVPLKRNVILIFGVIIAQGIHVLSMQIPLMQDILRIQPINLVQWAQLLALAIPIIIVMEIYKFINKKRNAFPKASVT